MDNFIEKQITEKLDSLKGWQNAEDLSQRCPMSADGGIVFVGADWYANQVLAQWSDEPDSMMPDQWFDEKIELLKIVNRPITAEALKNAIAESMAFKQIGYNYWAETRV